MDTNVENLIVAQLREIRGDLNRINGKVDVISVRVESLETQMMGMSLMMTTLFGTVRGLERRLERVERCLEPAVEKQAG